MAINSSLHFQSSLFNLSFQLSRIYLTQFLEIPAHFDLGSFGSGLLGSDSALLSRLALPIMLVPLGFGINKPTLAEIVTCCYIKLAAYLS